MTDNLDRAQRAFEAHEAFETTPDGYVLETVAFDNVATTSNADGTVVYCVTVWAPTLSAATSDPVGTAVADGWFETFQRRLEDAPKATRREIDLREWSLDRAGSDIVAEFVFTFGNAGTAPEVVKTLVEYVEGTYVEGIVPGYDYEGVAASLLSQASQGDRGGTPL